MKLFLKVVKVCNLFFGGLRASKSLLAFFKFILTGSFIGFNLLLKIFKNAIIDTKYLEVKMENSRYKVNRDDVCVGKVVVVKSEIESLNGQVTLSCWQPCRSMIFVPNADKMSDDLLFDTKNYPILNISSNDVCLNLSANDIVVKDAFNIAELLRYFGYRKELSYTDILKIRKIFFDGKFGFDNCELFGFREWQPEESTFYRNGEKVTDPREIEKCILLAKREQARGSRSFGGIENEMLPHEYFDMLRDMGDEEVGFSLLEGLKRKDAFLPDKKEGLVRKLKMF